MTLNNARKSLLKLAGILALASTMALPACRKTTDGDFASVVRHASRKTLTPFKSDAELSGFLKKLADAQKKERERTLANAQPGYGQPAPSAMTDSPAQAEAAQAPSPEPSSAAKDSEESVTNTQHAGVDEGGIVKVHGDHLVVLRRGRLFTIKIGDGALNPISTIDAFGPDINPGGTWYDEMLVTGDTIAVVGYSYERGGTEIGLFDIDRGGRLGYRATYHLRSNDYYSSRNYASRMIGSKLIFYTPLYLSLDEKDLFRSFPALRKWRKGAKDDEFRRITAATRVYRPLFESSQLALHTVTVCDLAKRDLSCEATAILGPPGRVFYVSPGSVFVWVSEWETQGERSAPRALVYRMPLDGSAPSALGTMGAPVDQFSFLEDNKGNLNVLLRSEAAGDAMWAPEVAQGDVAMLRVPLESFSDGVDRAPKSAYHRLPKPEGHTFQNRFVGDYLLYGTGSGWGSPEESARGAIFAYRYASDDRARRISLTHGVDRIEALGADAVIVGTDGKNLHFSPIALGSRPRALPRYTRKDASQGELRSHGFFYKPHDDHSGLLGLPIREAGRPGYEHLFNDSASVLFLRNDSLHLAELGALGARPEGSSDDQCKASCVDWYGNARPLFLKNRVFALLGYEMVEGALDAGRIKEKRRVSFAPSIPKVAR